MDRNCITHNSLQEAGGYVQGSATEREFFSVSPSKIRSSFKRSEISRKLMGKPDSLRAQAQKQQLDLNPHPSPNMKSKDQPHIRTDNRVHKKQAKTLPLWRNCFRKPETVA